MVTGRLPSIQLLLRQTPHQKSQLRGIEGAFFANLVTHSDCGKVTSCHFMVYVEALSRICACLTTRHSASDFSCGSNGTYLKERLLTDRHTLHQKSTPRGTSTSVKRLPLHAILKTRYLNWCHHKKARRLPCGKSISHHWTSSVKFCRITKDTWKNVTDTWDGYHSVPLRHYAICQLERQPSTLRFLVIEGGDALMLSWLIEAV